jgi:hypothetical protein
MPVITMSLGVPARMHLLYHRVKEYPETYYCRLLTRHVGVIRGLAPYSMVLLIHVTGVEVQACMSLSTPEVTLHHVSALFILLMNL